MVDINTPDVEGADRRRQHDLSNVSRNGNRRVKRDGFRKIDGHVRYSERIGYGWRCRQRSEDETAGYGLRCKIAYLKLHHLIKAMNPASKLRVFHRNVNNKSCT